MTKRLLILGVTLVWGMTCIPASPLPDLPGEEIVNSPLEKSTPKEVVETNKPESRKINNWIAPSVNEQLDRDKTLIPLGKGALFIPTFSEPRREPEVSVFKGHHKAVASGQTGERILIDSGTYTVRLGSGSFNQQQVWETSIKEGHTTTLAPLWGELIVETINAADGQYIEGAYEVIRMDKWINYGKGRGRKEERLQDIKAWILPPGLYRISKVGEGYSSYANYITVQISEGELTSIELVFDGDKITAGGIKAITTRQVAGKYWHYGLRAGGNVNVTSSVDEAELRKENIQVASDIRLRAKYDNTLFFGLNEIVVRNSFIKNNGERFTPSDDKLQIRSTWVRRLNKWMGPYVRGQLETQLFPVKSLADTVHVVTEKHDSLGRLLISKNGAQLFDTTSTFSSGDFIIRPSFYPLSIVEGIGLNLDLFSQYYLEFSTQIGLAAHQKIVGESYTPISNVGYLRNKSEYIIGAENIINAKVALSSILTLDLRTELFAPNANLAQLRLEDLTADFRLYLTRNLELGYIFDIKEVIDAQEKKHFPHSQNISLRFSINF